MDWGTYLTTSEAVIYAVIDGRGSGYRGNDLLHEIYYKLGQPEVQDQIDVTKRLVDQYAFIDAIRYSELYLRQCRQDYGITAIISHARDIWIPKCISMFKT